MHETIKAKTSRKSISLREPVKEDSLSFYFILAFFKASLPGNLRREARGSFVVRELLFFLECLFDVLLDRVRCLERSLKGTSITSCLFAKMSSGKTDRFQLLLNGTF